MRCGEGMDISQEAPEGNADRAQGLGHCLREGQAHTLARRTDAAIPKLAI